MSIGIGNILKNIFLIPRPSHPVWVPSGDPEKDHGLPSTHTMSATTLPWYYLLFLYYLEPRSPVSLLEIGLVFLWTVSVALSRVYNGHHTPLDVGVGALLGVTMLAAFTFEIRHWVDAIILSHSFTGMFTLIGTFVSALVLHPVPPKIPTPAFPETGLVTGTATGAVLGAWIRHNSVNSHHVYSYICEFFHWNSCSYPPPLSPFLANRILLVYILRFILGVVVVMIVRVVVKKVATLVILRGAKLINKNTKYTATTIRHTEVETAVKYITYTCIALVTTTSNLFFVPIGLHLPVDDIGCSKF